MLVQLFGIELIYDNYGFCFSVGWEILASREIVVRGTYVLLLYLLFPFNFHGYLRKMIISPRNFVFVFFVNFHCWCSFLFVGGIVDYFALVWCFFCSIFDMLLLWCNNPNITLNNIYALL